jgi:hypothetical protein
MPYGGKYYPVKLDSNQKKYIPNLLAKPINGYPAEYCDNFRGHKYYEQYTSRQLDSLKNLLKDIATRNNIPKIYKGDNFWTPNYEALSGRPGIWGHCSYRLDKSDPHMQHELVQVLKSL